MKKNYLLHLALATTVTFALSGCNNEKKEDLVPKVSPPQASIATATTNRTPTKLPTASAEKIDELEPAKEVTENPVKTIHFADIMPGKTAPSITISGPVISKEKAEYCRTIEGGVIAGQSAASSIQTQRDETLRAMDNDINKLQSQGLNRRAREQLQNRQAVAEAFEQKLSEVKSSTEFVAGGRANCK